MDSLPVTLKVIYRHRTPVPRTGTFPQKQVTAGDTACSVKGVQLVVENSYDTENSTISSLLTNFKVYAGVHNIFNIVFCHVIFEDFKTCHLAGYPEECSEYIGRSNV